MFKIKAFLYFIFYQLASRFYGIKIATTLEEKEKVFRFRYQVYIKEMNLKSMEKYIHNDMLYDEYDFFDGSSIFYYENQHHILGTLRATSWDLSTIPEKIKKKYGITDELFNKVKRVGELGFFIIKKEYRKRFWLSLVVAHYFYYYRHQNPNEPTDDILFANAMANLARYYFFFGASRYTNKIVPDEDGSTIPLYLPPYDVNYHQQNKSICYYVAKYYAKKRENSCPCITEIMPPIPGYMTLDQKKHYHNKSPSKKMQRNYHFITSKMRNVMMLSIASGEPVFKQGIEDFDIYFLLEGQLAIFVNGVQITELLPGEIFGELECLDAKHMRTADVIAVEPSKILLIPRSWLHSLERNRKEDALQFLHIICDSLSTKLKRSNQLLAEKIKKSDAKASNLSDFPQITNDVIKFKKTYD